METFEILTFSLTILFGLGLVFSILLWCRSWRREEHEAGQAQVRALAAEVDRVRDALEMLDHTAASLQTADAQLAEQIESLRRAVGRVGDGRPARPDVTRTAPARPAEEPRPEQKNPAIVKAQGARRPARTEPDSESPAPAAQEETSDRYTRVRELLSTGKSEIEVAKELDMGPAEVRMIARLDESKNPGGENERPNLIQRG